MKHLAVIGVLIGVGALPASAYAIDCTKATTKLDRLVCSDKRLVNADAAMGKAYAALLKSAPDAEVQKLMVGSQRRWIKARDEAFGDPDTLADVKTGNPYTKAEQREILLDAIEKRTQQLTEHVPGKPRYPRLIQTVLDQRTLASRFSGGPFAGLSVSCEFLPQSGRYSYGCFGTHFYQNKDRICSVSIDWASGSISEIRAMANVVDGKPTLAATCKPGENRCSSEDAANTDLTGWNESAQSFPVDAVQIYKQLGSAPLSEFDPEMPEEESQKWLQSCLSDPRYPVNALTKQ